MKHASTRLNLILVAVAVIILGMATVAAARDTVPAPYAGLKNPFDWKDAGVQAQGKKLYEKSCAGCHGAGGGNLATANFAAPGYSDALEAEPDYYYWVLTEGNLKNGMPPFKSSVSDEERWRILTYLWALGRPAPAVAPSSAAPGPQKGTLALAIEEQRSSPSRLMLTASLSDDSGRPVSGEPVGFYLKKSFFATDWMQVGEAASDKNGEASLQYFPSENGDIQLAARWGKLEATGGVTIASRAMSYHAEAGIRLPTIGPEVAIGLDLAEAEMGEASPTGGIRLPGGTLSWLLLFDAVILLVWTTYFRVFRVVMSIPESAGRDGLSVRLVPFLATGFVLVVGAVLALVILHGPYTHLHLGR